MRRCSIDRAANVKKIKINENRKLVMLALSNIGDCGYPPHSASDVGFILNTAFEYRWVGYETLKSVPNKRQIYRILCDLWREGFIVGTRKKEKRHGRNSLPSWVVSYQVSADVERNYVIECCDKLYKKVMMAKHGFKFSSDNEGLFKGATRAEVAIMLKDVRSLIQKTHPDKAVGMGKQFLQMKEVLAVIRSGIPEPAQVCY